MATAAQARQGARSHQTPANVVRGGVPAAVGLFAGLLALVPSSAAAQTVSPAAQALLGKKEVAAEAAVIRTSADPRIPVGERALLGRKVRETLQQTSASRQPQVDGGAGAARQENSGPSTKTDVNETPRAVTFEAQAARAVIDLHDSGSPRFGTLVRQLTCVRAR